MVCLFTMLNKNISLLVGKASQIHRLVLNRMKTIKPLRLVFLGIFISLSLILVVSSTVELEYYLYNLIA